jgi:hypothetical protein
MSLVYILTHLQIIASRYAPASMGVVKGRETKTNDRLAEMTFRSRKAFDVYQLVG